MKCLNCGFENSPNAKFCNNCGQPQALKCSNCGAVNPAGANFCNNCGFNLQTVASQAAPRPADPVPTLIEKYMPKELADKLQVASSSSSIEGERRIVTILFCDVKGSTAMAEQLDPEEWAQIMNTAFEYLIQPVYKYEGTVARLMGDAILAFFGAPLAHEDDPQRAILAGLDILDGIRSYRNTVQREHGMDFSVRVGVNTGLVVVGNIGSDLKYEYTAMGDAINLAARMQTTADPNTILISENTYRLVAPLFEFEDRGKIEVKGKVEPVHIYRVVEPKDGAVKTRGITGFSSPIVGRRREMHMLQARVKELLQGRGQIVSVMGEAGLGKSRLIAELRKSYIANHESQVSSDSVSNNNASSIRWLEGHSLSFQSSTPYAPFVDLFSTFCNLQPGENDFAKYEKVKAKVGEYLPGRVNEIAPFLAMLLGVELIGDDLDRIKYLQPPDLRQEIFRAIRELMEHIAGVQPTVLVFEDLHWADTTSLDLIEHLMALTDRAMLMLIALFRPQRSDLSWCFHETAAREYTHRYTSVVLEPLDEQETGELVANLLQIEDLPASVRELILHKTEGNPFFVEEVIRSLLDQKFVVRENTHWRATREIENIAVPDTLMGVITARLDRLDENSKRVAQTASVIGREFALDVLADVSENPTGLEEALLNLQRRELVREKAWVPRIVYLFKHALTQETAYASILLSRRRELHRRVAEYLERAEPEQVNEIAHHFLQAHVYDRALSYLVAAGDRAARAFSNPEALAYYTRAVELTKTVDDLHLARRAYEGLGRARELANDLAGAATTYEQMDQFGQSHDNIPMRVSALNKLSMLIALRLGEYPEAEKRLLEAEHLAREFQDRAGLAEMFIIRCYVCLSNADFDDAIKNLNESLEFGRNLDLKEQVAFSLTHIATTQVFTMHFDEAAKTIQEAQQLMVEIGDHLHLAELETCAFPCLYFYQGELDTARQVALDGTNLAGRLGAAFWEALGAWLLGRVAQARGKYEEALIAQRHALRAARTSMVFGMPGLALAALADLYTEISPKLSEQITPLQQEAAAMLEDPNRVNTAPQILPFLGYSALGQNDLGHSAEFFQMGLVTQKVYWLVEKPLNMIGIALTALAQGNSDEAAKWVGEARVYVEEHALKIYYPLVTLTDAQVQSVTGDNECALEQFTRAESLASEMKMSPIIWQARGGAAKVMDALGRKAEAVTKRQEAMATIDEIANLFEDDQLRTAFVENATWNVMVR